MCDYAPIAGSDNPPNTRSGYGAMSCNGSFCSTTDWGKLAKIAIKDMSDGSSNVMGFGEFAGLTTGQIVGKPRGNDGIPWCLGEDGGIQYALRTVTGSRAIGTWLCP